MHPAAKIAMLEVLDGPAGNPSSAHQQGRMARAIIDEARDQLASVAGFSGGQVVFTSGGTESNNLAILGRLTARAGSALFSAIEHPAVAVPMRSQGGIECVVEPSGTLDVAAFQAVLESMGSSISLVSIMAVNNELGTIQPLGEVIRLARELAPNAVVHVDAVQALRWLDLRSFLESADLVSLSAHKFGGPQGVGALLVRDRSMISARALGGGQERELRSGTQNVAGIAAMGVAAVAADLERDELVSRIAACRDAFVAAVLAGTARSMLTVPSAVAGMAHLCFAGIDSEALLFLLDENSVAASAASACASGAVKASGVLGALGVDPEWASGAVRFSFGPEATPEIALTAAGIVGQCVSRLREFPR